MEREVLKQLVKELVLAHVANQEQVTQIPIGVSGRHLHISEADFKILFPNEDLRVMKMLKQTGEFAAEQTVTVIGSKDQTLRVRILGPFRNETQLEISKTDARNIGVPAQIRMSGELHGSPGVKLKTDAGEVTLKQGVIVAKRHIHMPTNVARDLGVTEGEEVALQVKSEDRSLIFQGCVVRVNDDFELEAHIDIDEANAADVSESTVATIVKI